MVVAVGRRPVGSDRGGRTDGSWSGGRGRIVDQLVRGTVVGRTGLGSSTSWSSIPPRGRAVWLDEDHRTVYWYRPPAWGGVVTTARGAIHGRRELRRRRKLDEDRPSQNDPSVPRMNKNAPSRLLLPMFDQLVDIPSQSGRILRPPGLP